MDNFQYKISGLTVEFVYYNAVTLQVWSVHLTAWTTWVDADYNSGYYSVAATEQGSSANYVVTTTPPGIIVPYYFVARQHVGGTIATDVVIGASSLDVLAAIQSFNNTGQTTPIPAQPSPGYTVNALAGSNSTTAAGANIIGERNYPFTFAWTYSGFDLTGWTQVVFTAKANYADADSAAILTVKVSNPPAGTDGLTILNGASPVSPVVAADGSLVITITPTSNQTPVKSAVSIALDARAMGVSLAVPPQRLLWELTWYNSSGKQPALDNGTLSVEQSVRQNPVTS